MKKDKIYRLLWIGGTYLLLIVLLFLVVEYKVKWEGRDLNKYLYFYECSSSVCTSELKPEKYYSRYLCKDTCPRVKNILENNIVILEGVNNGAIFNYKDNKIINDSYISYILLTKDRIAVDNGSKKGIIDLSGNIILDFDYDDIAEYFDGYISIKKNNMWGIKNLSNDKQIPCKYDELKFINNNILLVKINNMYYLINYDDIRVINDVYNYLYYTDGYILAVLNKKIDIFDKDLHSKLVMKIDTTYEYSNKEERDSLNITSDSEYIYFYVYTNDGYIKYNYSKNKNAISY